MARSYSPLLSLRTLWLRLSSLATTGISVVISILDVGETHIGLIPNAERRSNLRSTESGRPMIWALQLFEFSAGIVHVLAVVSFSFHRTFANSPARATVENNSRIAAAVRELRFVFGTHRASCRISTSDSTRCRSLSQPPASSTLTPNVGSPWIRSRFAVTRNLCVSAGARGSDRRRINAGTPRAKCSPPTRKLGTH